MARLREEEAATGKSFKQLVNDLLRLGITSSRQVTDEPPFVVRSRPLGLRPGLSYDNIHELLEATEGPYYR